MPRPPIAPCAALSLIVAACGAATEPAVGAEAGRYVATAAAGRALPALTDSSAQEFGVVLADTLELDGRGGARRAVTVRRASPARGEDAVYRSDRPVTYRRSGARLEVGFFTLCRDGALCALNDTGAFTPAGVSLVSFQYAGGVLVEFTRVAP